MNQIESLAKKTESAFVPIAELRLQERRVLFPDSSKGGFVLTFFDAGGRSISVEYLELQFEARIGDVELFGPNIHPGFAGNMFSREHFLEHLPMLAAAVQSQLAAHQPAAG